MRYILSTLFLTSAVQAATAINTWVTWTSHSAYNQSVYVSEYDTTVTYGTTAQGYINIPSLLGGGTVNVTYNGEVTSWSKFDGTGVDVFADTSSFLAPSVTSLAPSRTYIALTGYSGATNTLTFTDGSGNAKSVTNLVMDIGSLGGERDAAYQFDQEFVIDSRGAGAWGSPLVTLYKLSDSKTAYGQEANGTIQFNSTFSSLSWTTPRREIYSAFNIGMSDTPGTDVANAVWGGSAPNFSDVPEPSTYGLIGLGALGVAFVARRRKSKTA